MFFVIFFFPPLPLLLQKSPQAVDPFPFLFSPSTNTAELLFSLSKGEAFPFFLPFVTVHNPPPSVS